MIILFRGTLKNNIDFSKNFNVPNNFYTIYFNYNITKNKIKKNILF